jgi:hypothetical protein
MSKYRVQVMVGVDVSADTDGEAMVNAVAKVRGIIGENPTEPMPKEAWVTGIALADPAHWHHTSVEGYMVFRQPDRAEDNSLTVAED